MQRYIIHPILILFLFSLIATVTQCSKDKDDDKQSSASDIWDIDKDGIPKFVDANYIELSKIYRISKFRSSYGHDYSDAFEHCRSMKHYFEPKGDVDWAAVKIYSPVSGSITRIENEWAGTKIEIVADDYPAFRFSIFHINLTVQRNVGDKIQSGQQLGMHIGSQTMSDISVLVNDPTKQGRMVSYFEVITAALFTEYAKRGVIKKEDVIISKAYRDANPLTCNGETFISSDIIENWVVLK